MAECRTPRTPKRAENQHKSGPRPRSDWHQTFVEALRTVPIVKYACREAGIGRTTAYEARRRDENFAVAWADAIDEGLDSMERVAHARATAGQLFTKTVTKTHPDGTVETTVTEERRLSDNLLMFMLKRYRPEFRESYRMEQSGPDGGPIRHSIERDEVLDNFDRELDRLRDTD
jgi:hypothetical protein